MWTAKRLNELTPYELQEIYALRVKVFVVEQQCPYQEVDDADLHCIHLFYKEAGKIIAYARLIPEKEIVHIGRVCVHPDFRQQGKARELLEYSLLQSRKLFGNLPIHAQAQAHLQDFYASFGFQPVSEVYLEDSIPHIDMVLVRNRQPHRKGGEEDE